MQICQDFRCNSIFSNTQSIINELKNEIIMIITVNHKVNQPSNCRTTSTSSCQEVNCGPENDFVWQQSRTFLKSEKSQHKYRFSLLSFDFWYRPMNTSTKVYLSNLQITSILKRDPRALFYFLDCKCGSYQSLHRKNK